MKFKTAILAALMACAHFLPAQQQMGPVMIPQLNHTLFVGQVPGFYPTIQSAVTVACAMANGATVNIPFGTSPADTIAAATGCTKSPIVDERAQPVQSWSWNGTAYALNSLCETDGTNCPTLDLIKPAFTLSLSGGQTLEIGQSVVNPTFTASYNQTPSAASLTNTANINSPFTLVSPFTSAALTGTFTESTASSVSFTLSATSGTITKTTGTSFQWLPRNWGGVGAAGATSATTSGTTAKLSTSDVLQSVGLTSSNAGHVYGPFSASSQKVYLLLSDGNHTFKDNSTGFAFLFNTPTTLSVVNQYGATVTMYLYESTNVLTGSFSVLVN